MTGLYRGTQPPLGLVVGAPCAGTRRTSMVAELHLALQLQARPCLHGPVGSSSRQGGACSRCWDAVRGQKSSCATQGPAPHRSHRSSSEGALQRDMVCPLVHPSMHPAVITRHSHKLARSTHPHTHLPRQPDP